MNLNFENKYFRLCGPPIETLDSQVQVGGISCRTGSA